MAGMDVGQHCAGSRLHDQLPSSNYTLSRSHRLAPAQAGPVRATRGRLQSAHSSTPSLAAEHASRNPSVHQATHVRTPAYHASSLAACPRPRCRSKPAPPASAHSTGSTTRSTPHTPAAAAPTRAASWPMLLGAPPHAHTSTTTHLRRELAHAVARLLQLLDLLQQALLLVQAQAAVLDLALQLCSRGHKARSSSSSSSGQVGERWVRGVWLLCRIWRSDSAAQDVGHSMDQQATVAAPTAARDWECAAQAPAPKELHPQASAANHERWCGPCFSCLQSREHVHPRPRPANTPCSSHPHRSAPSRCPAHMLTPAAPGPHCAPMARAAICSPQHPLQYTCPASTTATPSLDPRIDQLHARAPAPHTPPLRPRRPPCAPTIRESICSTLVYLMVLFMLLMFCRAVSRDLARTSSWPRTPFFWACTHMGVHRGAAMWVQHRAASRTRKIIGVFLESYCGLRLKGPPQELPADGLC